MHGGLIPVGRYEPPFSESTSPAAVRLSRRHARIFAASDDVYIVDLGSSNGTTVNSKPIGREPVRLFNSDEVTFASHFTYSVQIPEHLRPPSTLVDTPALQLTLAPITPELDTVIVSRFSFLVGKNSDLFAPYRETHARELNYLSRRHAHIFERDGELYIEDLGSTNGTYVCGQRLDEHARKLNNGDTVGFGGDFFVYDVGVQNTAPPTENPTQATLSPTSTNALTQAPPHTERDAEAKTTFVSTASSFLEIFYDQQDAADEADNAKANRDELPHSSSGSQHHPRRVSFFGRLNASIDELRGETKAGETRKLRWFVLVTVAVLAIGLVSGWLYFEGTPVREIKNLNSTKEYTAAAAKADTYLQAHPNDNEVRRLASKALLNTVIPQWSALLKAGDYDAAAALLTRAASMARYNTDGQAMLAMLTWITDLDRYYTKRMNTVGTVTIFEDEIKINRLIDIWESDPDGHRLMLSRMTQFVPEFESSRVNASSQLTKLYSDRSEFLQVIKELKQKAMAYLGNGQEGEVEQLISLFEQKYTSVTGTEVLHKDYATYMSYHNAIEEKDVAVLWQLSETAEFSTPLFNDAADRYLTPEMPSSDILKQYAEARTAWQSGHAQGSRQILESLTSKPWGEVAARRIEEQTQVLTAFDALQQVRGTASYNDQMLAFHALVDPEWDIYYIDQTASAFEILRKTILTEAESDYAAANSEWTAYLEQGRITGLLRLEDSVSIAYRKLAITLSNAHARSQAALAAYQSIHSAPPGDATALANTVADEILRQRTWLQELDVVLNRSLLEQKLALLPQL